jgi:hypothetical protein
MANLLRACICQGEQTHGIDGRVAENGFRILVDGGVGKLFLGQSARLGANVVDGGDLPKIVIPHRGNKLRPIRPYPRIPALNFLP